MKRENASKYLGFPKEVVVSVAMSAAMIEPDNGWRTPPSRHQLVKLILIQRRGVRI